MFREAWDCSKRVMLWFFFLLFYFFPLKMNSDSETSAEKKRRQLGMFCFHWIDLANEYENEQELELFCGTCRMLCSSVPKTEWGFFRLEVCAWTVVSFALGLHRWRQIAVVPHALLLSIEPDSAAGSPPSWKRLLTNSMNSREDVECWI